MSIKGMCVGAIFGTLGGLLLDLIAHGDPFYHVPSTLLAGAICTVILGLTADKD